MKYGTRENPMIHEADSSKKGIIYAFIYVESYKQSKHYPKKGDTVWVRQSDRREDILYEAELLDDGRSSGGIAIKRMYQGKRLRSLRYSEDYCIPPRYL